MPCKEVSEAVPREAFHAYSDGSCTVVRRQAAAAGWGFVLFKFGVEPSVGEDPEITAFGPVITDRRGPLFLGAERLTNNTAEVSAVIEFLLWVLSETDNVDDHIFLDAPIVLHTDSTYVLGILSGKFQPRENRALSMLAIHLWRCVRKRLTIFVVWVKGHSMCYGNDCADTAARNGGDVSFSDSWWQRLISVENWDSDEFLASCVSGVQSQGLGIGVLTSSIVDGAKLCGASRGQMCVRLASDDPDVHLLKSATCQRRQARDPELRQKLSIQICRVRRRMRRRLYYLKCEQLAANPASLRAFSTARRRNVAFLKDNVTNVQVSDKQAMSQMMTVFFQKLFAGRRCDAPPSWIFRAWDPSSLNLLPRLDGHLVRTAAVHLKTGKTCACDHLVAEMLHKLDDDIYSHLSDAFRDRLLNTKDLADDGAWDTHLVTLLQKKGFQNRVSDFRPIAVIPVMQKLFSQVMLELAGDSLDSLIAPQYAFRKGHQAHEVIFVLRNLVEKALEWDTPLFVLDGDIAKAYDYTRHSTLIAAMQEKSVPPILIAAWVRELRRSRSIFALDADTRSEPVARTRSLLQGDPAAPALFNIALDHPASKFISLCARRGWGFKLDDGSLVSMILFADNFWLVASSPQSLAKMTEAWLALLKDCGWSVPLAETTWCTTGGDDNLLWEVLVEGQALTRAQRNVGFKVLGAQLTFDNSFETELVKRISHSWRAFYKFAPLLCCRSAPLKSRLQLLVAVVVSVLLYCSGSWNLTKTQISKIRGVQQSMLQKMVRSLRQPDEPIEAFMQRWRRRIKRVKATHCFKDWDDLYHRSVFLWGGYLAQIAQSDPLRITARVFEHRSWRLVSTFAFLNHGSQGHDGRVRIWRWERRLYKPFGDSWLEMAQRKTIWKQHLEEYISWQRAEH